MDAFDLLPRKYLTFSPNSKSFTEVNSRTSSSSHPLLAANVSATRCSLYQIVWQACSSQIFWFSRIHWKIVWNHFRYIPWFHKMSTFQNVFLKITLQILESIWARFRIECVAHPRSNIWTWFCLHSVDLVRRRTFTFIVDGFEDDTFELFIFELSDVFTPERRNLVSAVNKGEISK